MKTQLTLLPAGEVTEYDSGNLVLQGFISPEGDGEIVAQALVDGVAVREMTFTVPTPATTVIAEDFFQHQVYSFDCTGMSEDSYAIFTSMRL